MLSGDTVIPGPIAISHMLPGNPRPSGKPSGKLETKEVGCQQGHNLGRRCGADGKLQMDPLSGVCGKEGWFCLMENALINYLSEKSRTTNNPKVQRILT